ncbi:MAG: DUF262 domain-containing HNH endonuclease family protein [Deltaproteobacteria bacterium]|nr:DUF262 domain-containing HNH endonuclease family protein [Deltaproteobacteria bacterium]
MDIQPRFMNLSSLLANRLFRIPRYQRAYSWTKKQRDDLFDDIRSLKNDQEKTHFMATVVGLRREIKTIVTDQYRVVDVVDGQQRVTSLVILLKAIEMNLNRTLTAEEKLGRELQELLVKQDNASLILLQTNHDKNHYFVNYLRGGERTSVSEAKILADRELLSAINHCESFVSEWDDLVELLRIIKNQLTFIFHEIDDEATVYTVFEVLNNRGLRVSWIDRLKSMLMAIAFQQGQDNVDEHIEELHNIWGTIYETIGLRQGMSAEALKFAATLKSKTRLSKPLSDQAAVDLFVELCETSTVKAIELSKWLLKVAKAVDRFLEDTRRSRAITGIAQARLLAVALLLSNHSPEQESDLLELWEKTSFRVFGLCRKDARTAVGEYVRLAWDILNDGSLNSEENGVANHIRSFSEGKEHSIEWAVLHLENENCYEGWEDELRYLLFRYEEYLAKRQGQQFSNEQWSRIWESSAAKSIEHVFPQSKGASERIEPSKDGVFVHRLGNLILLPPGLNSQLQDLEPAQKAESYRKTGLLCATEVATTIAQNGWATKQIEERENKLIEWITETWG